MSIWDKIKEMLRIAEPVADIAVAAVTFLSATGGLTKGQDGKWNVDQTRVKQIVPNWFGIGPNDNALAALAAAMVDSPDRTILESRLSRLRPEDRKVFILILATVPDKEDRKVFLNSLAKLPEPAFFAAVKNWRMIQIDTDLSVRVKNAIVLHGGQALAWLQNADNWRMLRNEARDLIRRANVAANNAAVHVETFSANLNVGIAEDRNRRRGWFNQFCRFLGIGGID